MKTAKIFILATALASSTANAAVLQDVQGDVQVGRDKGFARVQGSAELLPGDRVKVGRKGAARIVYPDGCSVPVGANSLSRIQPSSPCSFKAQFGAGAPAPAPAPAPCGELIPLCPVEGANPWVVAGLGLGVAGGIAAALATSQSSPSPVIPPIIPPPVSP